MVFNTKFFKVYFPHQKWQEVERFYHKLDASRKSTINNLPFKNPWIVLGLSGLLGIFGIGRFYARSFALGALKLVYFIFLFFAFYIINVVDKNEEIPEAVVWFVLVLTLIFIIWYLIDFFWSFWRTRRYNYRLMVKSVR